MTHDRGPTVDATPIFTEYYSAIRREIEDLIRRRDQYLILLLTAVGLVFGLFASKPEFKLVLLVLPLLCAYSGALYAQADRTIGAHVVWLREEYVPALSDAYGITKPTPWEASVEYSKYTARKGAFFLRYFTTSAILVVVSLLSAAIGRSALHAYLGDLGSTVASTVVALIGAAGGLLPIQAYRVRVPHAPDQPSSTEASRVNEQRKALGSSSKLRPTEVAVDKDQLHLEEFKQLNELLRFYTNLVLQTVTFVLSATGAVVAYVVKDAIMPRNAPYGFAIPAALCLGMGLGFLMNIRPAIQLRKRLKTLTDTLGFGLAPHARSLIGSLSFFGALLTVTGVVLFVIYMELRP